MKALIKKASFTPSVQTSQLPAIPSIKQPPVPSMTTSNTASKLPGIKPSSTKDPKKMAEQLKNPTQRKQTLQMLKFDANGQWTLEKNKE